MHSFWICWKKVSSEVGRQEFEPTAGGVEAVGSPAVVEDALEASGEDWPAWEDCAPEDVAGAAVAPVGVVDEGSGGLGVADVGVAVESPGVEGVVEAGVDADESAGMRLLRRQSILTRSSEGF